MSDDAGAGHSEFSNDNNGLEAKKFEFSNYDNGQTQGPGNLKVILYTLFPHRKKQKYGIEVLRNLH